MGGDSKPVRRSRYQDKTMGVLPGKHVESEEQFDQLASFLNQD